MSLSGPLFELTQHYQAKEYEKAAEIIEGIKDTDYAAAIFQLITKTVNVDTWLAFLKNPYLNRFLYHPELTLMLNKALVTSTSLNGFIKKMDKSDSRNMVVLKQKKLSTLLVAFAKNETWCRTMSYRFFLNFVPLNPFFASYIANSSKFLRHLDHFHISLLLTMLPRKTVEILTTVDSLILEDEEVSEWAIGILKWLIVHNTSAQKEILQECFADSVEQLGLEFEDNAAFALEVLQTPFLCEHWLGIKDKPYQHEKLTHKDYKCLMDYYLPSNPELGLQYAQLFNEAAQRELEKTQDRGERFEEMELAQDYPSLIVVVNSSVQDDAQALVDLVQTMSIESTIKHTPN